MAVVGNPQLLARPPTPPKGKSVESGIDEAIRALDTSIDLEPKSTLVTPPSSSPVHKQGNGSPPSTHSGRKKIRFTSEPHCIPDAPSTQFGHVANTILKPIPPSKLQFSSKSILKPFEPSLVPEALDSPTGFSPHKFPSFAAMLEYATQQLANSAPRPRIDGYRLLTDSLRAHEDIPNTDYFAQKLPLLEQFIRRDIGAISPVSNMCDTRLALPALKMTFLLFTLHAQTCRSMSNDFLEWLANDLVKNLEASNKPKEVLKNQLLLMSADSFWGRVLTPDKTSRIVKGMLSVHEKISGIAILGVRLSVYSRTIIRQPQVMSASIRHWLPQVLHAILSSNRDLQARAIEVGFRAADVYGKMPQTANALNEFFDQMSADSPEQSNFDKFESGVHNILDEGSPESKLDVPRIWSIMILFLRSSRRNLQYWSRIPRWMGIIQRCFNKSNHDLIMRAFTAWNRFIVAIKPDLGTRSTISRTICQLLVSHLIRPANTERARQIRSAALSSYCLFLFYAFRPTANDEQLSRYWKSCIVDLLDAAKEKRITEVPHLCIIVSAILFDSTLTVWNEDKPRNSAAKPMRPEDIPRLPSQWTRSNILTVLPVVERLFTPNWYHDHHTTAGPVRVWNSLLQTLVQAGDKEVLPSKETKKASEQIVEAFCNIVGSVEGSRPSLEIISSGVMEEIWSMAKTTLNSVGLAPLLETTQRTEVVGLAQSRPSDASGASNSAPIRRVFQAIARSTSFCNSDIDSNPNELLAPCLHYLQSRSARLRLLKVFTSELLISTTSGQPSFGSVQLWIGLMASLQECLQEQVNYQSLTHDLRDEYSDILYIVDAGLRINDQVVEEYVNRVLDDLAKLVRQEAGRESVMLGLWWPLLNRTASDGTFWSISARSRVVALLLSSLQPLQRQYSDDAEKALCKVTGSAIAPHYEQDWFQSLCSVASKVLFDLYDQNELLDERNVGLFFRAIGNFEESKGNIHPQRFLTEVRSAVLLWVRDAKHIVPATLNDSEILRFWKSLLNAVRRFSMDDAMDTSIIGDFYIAGFQTRHKDIAIATIDAWNILPNSDSLVNVSEQLRSLLIVLQDIAIVKLPTEIDRDQGSGEQQTAPDYATKFPWYQQSGIHSPNSRALESPQPLRPSRPTSSSVVRPQKSVDASSRFTVATSPRRSRHEDSQIEFISIASSPTPHARLESQMLTEHQKEVMKRQEEDRAQFVDLATSSPIPNDAEEVRRAQHRQPISSSGDGANDETPGFELENAALDRSPSPKPASKHPEAVKGLESPSLRSKIGEGEQEPRLPQNPVQAVHLDNAVQVEQEPSLSDDYIDALATQDNDIDMSQPHSSPPPVQVPTSQETVVEGDQGAVLTQQSNKSLQNLLPGLGSAEGEVVAPQPPDATDHAQADSAPPTSQQHDANADDKGAVPLSSGVEEVAQSSDNRAHTTMPESMIRAVSHSPPHATPRVYIPASKQSHPPAKPWQAEKSSITPTHDSISAQVKRKRTMRLTGQQPSKKTRLSNTRDAPHVSFDAQGESQEDSQEDSIVLGKGGPNTPSFYEVIREREASQSQKGSPRTKRSGRNVSTKQTSQSASRKRSFTAYADDDVQALGDQRATKTTTSQTKRLRSSLPTPTPARTTRSQNGARASSASHQQASTSTLKTKKHDVRAAKNRQYGRRRSTRASDGAGEPKAELMNGNAKDHLGSTPDLATSDNKNPNGSKEAVEALDDVFNPTTPSSSTSAQSADSISDSCMSQGSRIKTFREKLQGLWTDAKRLVLGGPEFEAERRDLEDMSFAFSREVILAGRRIADDDVQSL